MDEAEKLYNFLIKDMEDLPTHDPRPTTWVDNTKSAITDVFAFVKENQDSLAQGYEFIRAILAKKGKDLPSVASNVAKTVSETLPKIN